MNLSHPDEAKSKGGLVPRKRRAGEGGKGKRGEGERVGKTGTNGWATAWARRGVGRGLGEGGRWGLDNGDVAWRCVAYYTFLLFIVLHKYRRSSPLADELSGRGRRREVDREEGEVCGRDEGTRGAARRGGTE